MSTKTPNFGFDKPEYTDAPDIVAAVSNNLDTIDTQMQNSRKIMSDAWVASKAYTSGQYVIYNNTIYRCTADVGANSGTTPTADTSHFASTSLAAEISSMNNNLTIIQRRTRKDITSLVKNGTLSKAIKERNLEKYGITIGDYFVGPSGYTYHLGDRSPYYGGYSSYSVVNIPHVGIVVDTHTAHRWHSGDASTIGYNGCELHAYLKGAVLSTIESDIASLTGESYDKHLIAHQKLLSTALANWAWQANQYISALTEPQIYGTDIWSANGYQDGEACKQLEIFRKFRWNEIFGNIWLWLRNMQAASVACGAYNGGNADNSSGTNGGGRVVGLILFY